MRAILAVPMTFALLALSACDNQPTADTSADILAERAVWRSHNLTRYAYVYELSGALIAFAGHPIRLVVLNDSVASAQDLTTDSLLPSPSLFPTIEGLFARALAARSNGALYGITFDSTFGYPTRMDFPGPADGSGSILASDLQLLP